MRSSVKAILLCALLGGCSSLPMANLHNSVPLIFSIDVAPGYRNALFLEIDQGPFDLLVTRVKSSPSKKWKPAFYLSYQTEESDVRYYFNLNVDTDLNKMYGRARMIDVKQEKEISNRTHQQLYPLNHQFKISAALDGKIVTIYIDGQVADRQELPYEPKLLELGASSGAFNVIILSPPPPPAPN